jgi:hypothetical protein
MAIVSGGQHVDNYFSRRQWSSAEFAIAGGGVRLRTMQTLSASLSVEDLACRSAIDQPLPRALEHHGPRTCALATSRPFFLCSTGGWPICGRRHQ